MHTYIDKSQYVSPEQNVGLRISHANCMSLNQKKKKRLHTAFHRHMGLISQRGGDRRAYNEFGFNE